MFSLFVGGKRDEKLILPVNSSVSVTLSQKQVRISSLLMLNDLCTPLLHIVYPINMQHFSCKHVYFSIRVENSVNHDQMTSLEAS